MSELKDLVLCKVGRNVVNFQEIEGMLKLLVSQSNFKCPVSKIAETLDERKKNCEKLSLGSLTSKYFKSFNNKMIHGQDIPEDRDETWISLLFSIDNEKDILTQQKAAISFLVSERNRLIHQMLMDFDPESAESCNALIVELDKQNEMIQRESTHLQTLLDGFIEARNELLRGYI